MMGNLKMTKSMAKGFMNLKIKLLSTTVNGNTIRKMAMELIFVVIGNTKANGKTIIKMAMELIVLMSINTKANGKMI